ncbi:MAG: hypothetical protein HC910_16330 [Spirulinaceae cyanobacterium SM2_1_0]|nr:hypothetical protein [Spirulinaceae cyanobacterium SM2_1_0]
MESLAYLYHAHAYDGLSGPGDWASKGQPSWQTGPLLLGLIASFWALPLSVRAAAPPTDWQPIHPAPQLSQADRESVGLLQQGDRGERVEQLQRRLQAAGVYEGPLSGIFGEQTAAAVRRFQAARGLTVDGLVGAATWAALDASATATATPSPANLTRWQQQLQALGFYDQSPNGRDDAAMQAAVQRFQAARGLTVDGIIGPATREALTTAFAPDAIRDLQTRLQQGGFYTGAIDGLWGPRTQAAVEAAREVYGVSVADLIGNDY